MQKDEYLSIIKVLLVGGAETGKSQMLNYFIYNEFKFEYIPTIGIEVCARTIEPIENKPVTLQIFDASDCKRFKIWRISYYKFVNWIVMVYDITSRESFEKIETFIEEKQKYNTEKSILIIWGNKTDRNNERLISTEEGLKLADKYNAWFIETSAKDGSNINLLFNFASTILMDIYRYDWA